MRTYQLQRSCFGRLSSDWLLLYLHLIRMCPLLEINYSTLSRSSVDREVVNALTSRDNRFDSHIVKLPEWAAHVYSQASFVDLPVQTPDSH